MLLKVWHSILVFQAPHPTSSCLPAHRRIKHIVRTLFCYLSALLSQVEWISRKQESSKFKYSYFISAHFILQLYRILLRALVGLAIGFVCTRMYACVCVFAWVHCQVQGLIWHSTVVAAASR